MGGERGALMPKFAVDPDALRATAAEVDDVRHTAGAFDETCPADVGHAGLAKAISLLAADNARSWNDASDDLGRLAERLRQSAELYERTDRDLVTPEGHVEE